MYSYYNKLFLNLYKLRVITFLEKNLIKDENFFKHFFIKVMIFLVYYLWDQISYQVTVTVKLIKIIPIGI